MKTLHTLYKLDNNGRLRVWFGEIDGGKIRNVSGLEDGEKVISGWKLMKVKNANRSNATTVEEQAEVEMAALYEKQLGKGGYFEDREVALSGTKKYIEPMLAQRYQDVEIVYPDGITNTVCSQPKLDGHRCIATKDGLFTRNGKRYVSVPHIEFALMRFFRDHPDLILDGELYNHALRENFNEISSCVRKTKPTAADLMQSSVIEYHVYDIVDANMEFEDRSLLLMNLLTQFNPAKVVWVETHGIPNSDVLDAYYADYLNSGYEGQMIRYNQPYEIGKRSPFLIKRKEFFDQEYLLVDIEEGLGNWAGYAKSLVIQLEDGTLSSSGIRGDREFTKELLENKAHYIGGEVTVRFPNKTPDGKPRFPVATAFHPGKRTT